MFRPTKITNTAPTVNDDFSAGYHEGFLWFDTSSNLFYVCEDNAEGSADWEEAGGSIIDEWKDWTPSITWTGNTPTGVSTVARYIKIRDTVYFTLYVTGTTAATVNLTDMDTDLPVTALQTNNIIPVENVTKVGASYLDTYEAVIDCTSDPKYLKHLDFPAIAPSTQFRFYFQGIYEAE